MNLYLNSRHIFLINQIFPFSATINRKMARKSRLKKRKCLKTADEEVLLLSEKRSKMEAEEATFSSDVERVAALLETKKLVILQGPHGCGKTHTAGQVAHRRSIPIKVLQINDQYDSKVLYGSYNCSEVPGAFLWQPSKFAQFLQQPCVILLKNLDHGGPDLAAAITELAERGHAALANGRHIRMDAECRILGALSTDDHHHNHHLQQLWRDYPFTVKMGPLQLAQMDSILAATTKMHSELDNVRAKILETFTAVSELILARKTSMDRALSAKDLFRVVRRLVVDHQQHTTVTDRCALFAELFDGWAAHLTGTELRHSVAAAIGEALSLSTEQQHYHMNVRHPDVSFLEENGVQRVRIGRITLDRHEQQHNAERRPFVHTRDAAQLLERVAACVARSPPEPVLLTGDTGVGKTAIVQHIAHLSRVSLHVVNLSQESEFSDLVGGHKPTSATNILRPLVDDYVSLFRETFDAEKNAKFLDNLNHCFNAHRFADLVQLVVKSSSRALQKFAPPLDACDTRRSRWTLLRQRARRLAKCFRPGGEDDGAWRRRLLFAHVKGVLTEAAERGDWLLVDEINLAPVECMDALVELLDPSSDFIVHANFRLFACMNSVNDVGKRVLPLGIRSAFTEFYVDETRDEDQLRRIIRDQILSMDEAMVEAVLQFYMDVRSQFPGKFNLRTLSRALAVANDQQQQLGTAKHCLHRACAVAFVSQLDAEQRKRMQLLVTKWLGDVPTLARNAKLSADEMRKFVLIEGHKIPRGNEMPMFSDTNGIADDITETDNATTDESTYIFTPSVRANMALLASVVATGHFPILMEGETSAGKTSMVMQLAKMSGNRCFRINNHEHTDVQEYIGSYAPDATGRLEFVEGVLLRAVRNGDWIILDELNLAPSSVLEALNRLLDDNRELFVSELNVAVRAHSRFRLFATQNPVGTYAGRKRLSRAFLSRFMCLQWDALPHAELPQIVQRRCGVSPKMAQLMADVLAELKVRRAVGSIFSSSDGLMTLRDLFRWGHRMSSALVDGQATADWRQALADQGYFVLGTRCRTQQDEQAVVDVLKRLLDPKIDFSRLFSAESPYMPSTTILPGLFSSSAIVLTAQMRRMLILCAEAWRRNEPILLVGETGCGKTTAVHQFGHLLSINCHERTDAADLLGSIRPITAEDDGDVGGFRWRDGIVLQAMRRGQRLLIDEISLAPDSVLERLNSLLEPQRAILLTDAGAQSGGDETVTAADGFQLVATMNPGNDHGKKELSKALRNRFTEVWCPAEHDRDDLLAIVRHRFEKLLDVDDQQQLNGQIPVDKVAQLLIKFNEFFNGSFNDLLRFSLSTRDLVTLSELFANFYIAGIPVHQALYHAIEANLLDALGVLPSRLAFDRQEVIDSCIKQLHTLIKLELGEDFTAATASSSHVQQQLELNADTLSIGLFRIQCNRQDGVDFDRCRLPVGFSLDAPTTRRNAMRVARALASSKPVMLEGSPGAGKSSLVVALAAATGHKLVRLNLSEQTDLHDLFGGDVPVPDSDGSASFAWRDGPVLKAIKEGSWILLDEMNLASQSVLEGLNSCFDFRKRIYIAELDRTFELDSSRCKFFACQNPHQQGGARRALPKSFLNRFISIFVEEMTDDDFIHILCEFCKAQQQQMAGLMDNIDDDVSLSSPLFTEDRLAKMVLVNKLCRERVRELHQCGGPFEFNLRDLFRWVEAVDRFGGNFAFGFELVYLSRLTRQSAKDTIITDVYNPVFGDDKEINNAWVPSLPLLHLTNPANTDGNELQLNIGCVPLQLHANHDRSKVVPSPFSIRLLASQHGLLERVAACVSANWLVLLTGPPHVGKRSTVRALATLVDQPLEHIRLTSETDALELLGSFEQVQNHQQQRGQMGNEDDDGDNKMVVDMDCDDDEMNGRQEEDDGLHASGSKSNLRFEWVDSVFVRAFRDGHWLLVDDVNCCSSAVLDCLNSCLESADGELVLPVQHQKHADGTVLESKICRHANFRIFFTMNPRNGQLSRAMRNRAVELAFGTDPDPGVEPSSWSADVVDVVSAVFMPNRTTTESESSTSIRATMPSSQKQCKLVTQLQHTLQGSTDCSTMLCCAAQLPSRSRGDAGNNWMVEQPFLAGLEQFIQLLLRYSRADDAAAAAVVDDYDERSQPILGFNTFPPVSRPSASTISASNDELTLYYWHCWSNVSAFPVQQHAPHSDVCLQLAFMFPGSFDSQKRMWPTALQIGLFGTINETRQTVIFSLLSIDIGKTADDRLDLDQLLFDHTFPAEMRRWPDPRKLAINKTELGQKYMAILRASPAKCRPFLSLVELEQYRQRWLDNSSSESDEVLGDSTFGVFRRHFAKLINLVNRIFGENDSANTTALPWHDNEGCAGRMFEFGRVGSTDIGRHLFNNEKSQLLFSHLQLPFITFGLNTFLWSRLYFDNLNVLRHLRLAELATASVELDQTFLTTWELSFANRSLQNAAKNLFRQSAAQFDADVQLGHNFEPSGLSKVIGKLISMLGSLTPPRGLMDPPHFAHIQQMHWRERLQQVDVYLNALQMFLRLTIAKSYDVDQIVAICCASPASSSPLSPHSSAPILRQICAVHRDTANSLRQLDSDETQRTSRERSKSDPFVYRCCWTEGQESDYANHFRHEFVERLRSATAHLTEAIHTATDDASNLLQAFNDLPQLSNDGGGTALHGRSSTTTTNRLSVAQLHLHNLLSTISTLKALLTKTTTTTTSAAETSSSPLPPALFIYPDLVSPYLHVLNLLAIALAELHRQIGSALSVEHIRHKYGFSRVEFDAFTLLLHHCSSSFTRQLQNDKQSTDDDAVADVARCTEPFIRWLITDQWCPLTAHQRLPICLWSIASCHSRRQRSEVLEWILRLWERWHEQNARIQAEEQLVVIKRVKRKTRKGRNRTDEGNEEEETDQHDDEHVQLEPDEQKLRAAYLPDFSNSTFDAEPVGGDQPGHGDVVVDQLLLSGDALHNALCDIAKTLSDEEQQDKKNVAHRMPFPKPDKTDNPSSPPFLSLLHVADKLELYSTAEELDDAVVSFSHLQALGKLRELLQLRVATTTKFPSASSSSPSSTLPPLNVYRDSEPSALVHCVQCLAPFQHRVQQLLTEFPENAQLSTLNFSIDTFIHKAPAGAPLMKHAAQLEHILVRAEEWESIADRAHSVRAQMVPLQDVLVEWRRREVHCWASLVDMVRADCAQLAVLAGWPLFKCALDTLQNADQKDGGGTVPLLAFVDWMHSSTVGDFDARLWTGQLLTKFIHNLAPNCAVTATLCRRMRCACAHFAQFGQAVHVHFADRFAPVERSLRDFCRAVRYTDLNVWSVRDSARRAHTQLIRILRDFKNLNDEPVLPLLFDKLSPLLEWTPPTTALDRSPPNPMAHSEHEETTAATLSRSLTSFVTRLGTSVVRLLDMDALDVLRADAIGMLKELQIHIIYDDCHSVDQQQQSNHNLSKSEVDNVRSINEKRHGRALFTRQQQFARLVRTAARIGLNARRAQHIDSEQLTMQTLAETDALDCLPETIGTHFRNTTAARNVFLRQFANYRRHQSQQQQQLTPATLQQLRNTVEFALHWMHNAISALGQQRFADAHQRALHITRCIELEAQNAAAAIPDDDAPSHAHMSSVFVRNGRLINMLTTIIDRMRQLHQLCPRQHSSNSGDDQQHIPSHPSTSISLSLNAFQTPLGSLRQPSTEHAELDADLSALELLLKRLKRSHSDVLVSSVRVTGDCYGNDGASAMEDNNLHIWKRTNWRTYTDCLREFHRAFSELSLAKLGTYFVDECAKLGPTFGQLLQIDEEIMVESRPTTAAETNLEFEEVERAILLYLQSIYKEIERYNNNDGNGAPPVLDSVKRVLEFVNKLNSDKVLGQLCDWFFANSSVYNALTSSSSATTASRLVSGYTLAHGLCSALCHLHHHIGTLVSQLASFHAHWTAIGCHLLTNGFVNPIPAEDRREGAESKRVESGDGFGDADLAPNATDVSSQVENMEQIEGLKENGSDQQQQPMDERNDADQQQKQQMPDVEQPIDVEDDFAGCLEGLDTGEGEEGIDEEDNVEQQHEDIEDRADWNFGDVEEPEETQLDPQLWEPPEEQQQQDNIEEKGGDKQQQPMDECGKGDADPQQQMPEVDEPVGGEDVDDGQDWTAVEEAGGDKQRQEQLEQDGQGPDGEDNDEQQQHEEDMDEERADENNIGEMEEQSEEAQLDPQLHGLADEQQDNSEEQVDDQQQQPLNENDDADQQQKQQQKMSDVDQPVGVEDADGHDWTAVEEAGADKTRQEQLEHDDRVGHGADDEAESSSKQRRTTDGMDEENGRKNDQNEDEEMENNADDDEEIEVGDCEQRQLSAHASATLEQARRTRALFSAHLRRLRQKQRQGRSAELASEPSDADGRATDQQKAGKDGEEDDAAGVSDQQQMELDEVADGVEQQQDATGLQNQNIFNRMAEAERHAASMLLSADGAKLDVSADLIERLCADFDSLDQQQNDEMQSGRAGDEQRQLQLKWALITDTVAQLAAELAESLRAIIEPTIASRLEGDYRTGKRLNMRRLISYIASDYRKDRIWMRRTRKERRNYQICIAVDNSQSMQHNHMTEITCNALCLIERALRQLEVGQLALCSFGSQVQLIADFAASEHDCDVPPLGVRILRQLRFDQSRTDLGQLLDVSQTLFTRAREGGGAVAAPTEQLLIILGDGRGVFSEGVQRIRQAIARLSMDRVTVLFLVMDVPPPSPPSSSSLSSTNKSSSSGTHKSIMDMRIADFSVNGQCTFRPYMAQFPFPLYALVRDTHTLPATVAEAVRQWFEHTATG